jgi:hypothetical protein
VKGDNIDVNCRFDVTRACGKLCPLSCSRQEIIEETRTKIIEVTQNAGLIATYANVRVNCLGPGIDDSNFSVMQLICGVEPPTGEVYNRKGEVIIRIGTPPASPAEEAA